MNDFVKKKKTLMTVYGDNDDDKGNTLTKKSNKIKLNTNNFQIN